MGSKRILIVEDLEKWQVDLSDLLRTNGYEVDVAGDRQSAIERLDTKMYHLVILDIRLEDLNESNAEGWSLLQDIGTRYGEDSMVKIVLSAYGTREQMREAFKQHKVFDFISKNEYSNDEFHRIVKDAFEKEVRVNPDLEIVFEDGLTFGEIVLRITKGGKRVKNDDPQFLRFLFEIEDLFRRLFYKYNRIIIHRVTAGHGKAGVVRVNPFSPTAHDEAVIVKYGDYAEIDREYSNYEKFVKGKIGTQAASVLNLRRTPLLGGIVYSLIGARVEQVVDMGVFYRMHQVAEVNAILDHLFNETCYNWYADRGMSQYVRLTDEYERTLKFSHERLVEALQANFPNYVDQNVLTFRDLPGEHFPNPVYAVQGQVLGKTTYLCTTHGDLNGNNVLIDPNRHTWLIDFYWTGRGHVLRDCVRLEAVVKFDLLDEGGLKERLDLEKALAQVSRFKDIDGIKYNPPNESYEKAFGVCQKVRLVAKELMYPSDDFSEYEVGLLYMSLNAQRFYDLPKISRLHALLSAGILCEKLGLSAH